MHVVLALIFIGICLLPVVMTLWRPSALTAFCAVSGVFSIGYYGLPMLLIERSTLRYLPESEISITIGMALLFLVGLLTGVLAQQSRGAANDSKFSFNMLDGFLLRHWWYGAALSNAVIISYYALDTITIYQVSDVEGFFESQSVFQGLLGFLSSFAQAFSALYLVHALGKKNKIRILFAGAGILIQTLLVLDAGQRLVLITPLFLVMAAMVAFRSFRMAGATLGAGVAFLLIISPFAVAVRSGAWNNTQDLQAETFTYGENAVDNVLQSIVDRGDILQNMATLKAHVDLHGKVGPMYYYSVLVIPIPRAIYPEKPYVLSDTGTIDGDASVLAWRLSVGPSLGSLTAFGSIVAYREGGLLWVPINGFLTGLLIAFLLTWFQRSGFTGHAFFCMAFLNWGIRKVPPSLMEVMVDVMTYLPVLGALYVLNQLLAGEFRLKTASASVAHLGS